MKFKEFSHVDFIKDKIRKFTGIKSPQNVDRKPSSNLQIHTAKSSSQNEIIPVYCDVIIACCAKSIVFLDSSIQSILNQSHAHCRIHIGFDGEFPGQDAFINAYPNISFYRSDERVGPFRIANEITNECFSDFIAIQDADDLSLPSRIYHAINLLNESGADFYGASMEQFMDYRYPSSAASEKLVGHSIHQSGVFWTSCPSGALINATFVARRKEFIRFNGYGDLICSADADLSTRLHAANAKMIIDDKIVALRRLHSRSLTLTEYAPFSELRKQTNNIIKLRRKKLEWGEATPISLGAFKEHSKERKVRLIQIPRSENKNTRADENGVSFFQYSNAKAGLDLL